ncbi:2-dehydro-3-deoxygalactonokinase [Acuticoccus sp. M5D2P5]|uniref:2-dehydro-3-deoxygalactonokinase n=1 Tax=Acuticoccus kalidii TaxID=2910977 RepID=UPI001F2686AF|nr:2-dehydro-3-deoxygalactonokinase [Acuticoccus kalidii]MCF3932912.1 2-dehydro-3-deoxygalactonokinase [Acuticoccus kalidii]
MLIGVDWGTTRLRAYLVGDDGAVLESTESSAGLMSVPAGGFERVLAETVGAWRARTAAPILMSGMVGSRQGWREAPYVATPANLKALADGLMPVEAPSLGDVAIVPGVAVGIDGGAWADVMRGEEVEIFGALDTLGRTGGTFVLPGTHSKWVTVEDGAITDFRTYMTGELFGALKDHTILSKMMGKGRDEAAFAKGLDAADGLDRPGDLLTRFFSIRAEGLMGRLGEDEAGDFLSGLLIGAEVKSACAGVATAIIVGATDLGARYRRAFERFGVEPVAAPHESAAIGLTLIQRERAGI